MKDAIIGALALIAIAISTVALYQVTPHFPTTAGATSSMTGMLAENYIPYILYNGGYNSAKDIQTTANVFGAIGQFSTSLSVGTTTPSSLGDVVADGTATTTGMFTSSTANKGGCLQMENSLGVATRAYVGSAGNAWIVEAGTCK